MLCGIVGCTNKAQEWTPCCQEAVCSDHNEIYSMCSREQCMNDEKLCIVCLKHESYICPKCKLTLCSDCNTDEFMCDCDNQNM